MEAVRMLPDGRIAMVGVRLREDESARRQVVAADVESARGHDAIEMALDGAVQSQPLRHDGVEVLQRGEARKEMRLVRGAAGFVQLTTQAIDDVRPPRELVEQERQPAMSALAELPKRT